MSLTATDLDQIRGIVREEVRDEVTRAIEPLRGEIQALRNDIKEIYDRIVTLESSGITDKGFKKLPIEKRLLILNAELLAAAKEAGVVLPREVA